MSSCTKESIKANSLYFCPLLVKLVAQNFGVFFPEEYLNHDFLSDFKAQRTICKIKYDWLQADCDFAWQTYNSRIDLW